MYQQKIRSLVLGSPDVTAIIGQKLYALRAQQNTPPPYATMTTASYERVVHLRGRTSLENARVRFDMYGSNYTELVTLATAIEDVLAGASTFTARPVFGFELYEDDTLLYHLVRDFSIWNRT